MSGTNPFLRDFGAVSLDEVWDKIKKYTTPTKVYTQFDHYITSYQSHSASSENGDNMATYGDDDLKKYIQEIFYLATGDETQLHRRVLGRAIADIIEEMENEPLQNSNMNSRLTGLARVDRESKGTKAEGSLKPKYTPADLPQKKFRNAYIMIEALCRVDPTMAFEGYKTEQPAFITAAKSGLAGPVEIMVRTLEDHIPEDTNRTETILGRLSVDFQGSTAMGEAARSLHLGVLKYLSSAYPQLIDNKSLGFTISKPTTRQQGEIKDDYIDAFKLLASANGILGESPTQNDNAIWELAVKNSSKGALKLLLQPKSYKKFSTYERVGFIIDNGDADVWNMLDKKSREELTSREGCDFLHRAVSREKEDLVLALLEEFPSQAVLNHGGDEEPDYPLQRLKNKSPSPSFTTIRNQLVCAMICNKSLNIQEIRKILEDSHVDGYPMCLHLETLDTSNYSFADWVKSLVNPGSSSRSIFRFEKVLKYARFPNLRSPTSDKYSMRSKVRPTDYTEIGDIFDWLKRLEVNKVMEVSVPDRLYNPHSDDVIAQCVKDRGVRILKWKKLDLHLGSLKDKDYLEELDLYSSGNPSVHDQWYRELGRFKNLKRLSVYVVKDVLSETREKKVIGELREELNEIGGGELTMDQTQQEGVKFTYILTACFWDSDETHKVSTNMEDIQIKTLWPKLDIFVNKFSDYCALEQGATERTKVAIIDSGFVYGGLDQSNSSNNLAGRVVDGHSLMVTR